MGNITNMGFWKSDLSQCVHRLGKIYFLNDKGFYAIHSFSTLKMNSVDVGRWPFAVDRKEMCRILTANRQPPTANDILAY
jgi:hypothetical protein